MVRFSGRPAGKLAGAFFAASGNWTATTPRRMGGHFCGCIVGVIMGGRMAAIEADFIIH